MKKVKVILYIVLLLLCLVDTNGYAQTDVALKRDTIISTVPGQTAASDSTVKAVLLAGDTLKQPQVKLKTFKPDPNKALLYALIPGGGQIYNRKYWKLPLVYGAFMGCMYAITWNNKNYQEGWDLGSTFYFYRSRLEYTLPGTRLKKNKGVPPPSFPSLRD